MTIRYLRLGACVRALEWYSGGPLGRFWLSPGDEDFAGALKQTASKAKHPSTLESRLNEKLMLLEGLRLAV